jgi:hypothetical protein
MLLANKRSTRKPQRMEDASTKNRPSKARRTSSQEADGIAVLPEGPGSQKGGGKPPPHEVPEPP